MGPSQRKDSRREGTSDLSANASPTTRARRRRSQPAVATESSRAHHPVALRAETDSPLVWTMPADSRLTDPIPAWCTFTGQSPEAARGGGWIEALSPDDRSVLRQAIAHSLATERPYMVPCRVRRADGSYRAMRVAGMPVHGADGRLREWVVTCTEGMGDRRRERERVERTAELEALQAVTDVALAHLSSDQLLRKLLEQIRTVLAVDNVALLLVSDDGRELYVFLARGPEEAVAGQVRVPVGQGVAGRIAASRQPLIVDDLSVVEVANPFLQQQLRSLAGVPLELGDRLLGVLHVGSVAPRRFTQRDVRLLQVVADRVALALEHARLFADAQALRARLEAVIEAVPDALSLHDAQGRLVRLNRVGRELAGRASGGEDGVDLADLPHVFGLRSAADGPLPTDGQPVARALAGEQVRDAEMRRVLSDGRVRDVLVSAAPIRTAAGGIEGVVTVSRDVTRQREAERQAAQRASVLQATYEAMTDGVTLFDADGRIVYLNEVAHGFFDRAADPSWPARPAVERVQAGNARRPDGEALPVAEYPVLRLLAGEVLTAEGAPDVLVQRADGSDLVLNVTGAPIRDAAGQVLGAVAVSRDVTARRRLERRTQEALDAVLAMAQTLVAPSLNRPPDGAQDIWGDRHVAQRGDHRESSVAAARRLAELTCRVLGCHRVSITAVEPETERLRAVAVVGLTPTHEAQWWAQQRELEQHGRRLGEGADPGEVARVRSGDSVVLDMTQPPYAGRPNPYGVTTTLVAPMRVGDSLVGLLALDYGGVPHVFTVAERALAGAVAQLGGMVLERERLVRARAAAEAQVLTLEETARRMDEFLSIASHELRTPLTGLKTNLQLLERRVARVRQDALSADEVALMRTHLARATAAARRQERLVDDLLEVSRIQAGKLDVHIEPLDLAALVRACVEEHQAAHPDRTIRLAGAEQPISVAADADRVHQVLANFLTNALKYSPTDRPVLVEMEALVESAAGATSSAVPAATVRVRDEGPGLPREEHERIWERFHRVAGIEVLSGSGVGLGLGLYIARELVERQGGRVGVISTPGMGATFWFTLPVAATLDESPRSPVTGQDRR